MKLRFYILLITTLICAGFLFTNSSKENLLPDETPVSQKNSKYPINYAVGFHVEYKDGYKIVTVKDPWKSANKTFQYLLVPKASKIPKGYPDAIIVRTPVERIALLSITHVPLIEALDLKDKVVAFTKLEELPHPFSQLLKQGRIKSVGNISNPNLETLISVEPDLVMTYGTGDPERDSFPKILEIGIPTAINAEYMEGHPLGRFEWIKFVAVFFDLEDKASKVFNAVEKRYESLTKLVKNVSHRPSVLCGNNNRGVFYATGGNSYVAQWIKDAGGDYIWKEDSSRASRRMDFEVAIMEGRNAEFWILNGLYKTLDEVKNDLPQVKNFKSVKDHHVYSNNRLKHDGSPGDYWSRGLANPDLVLLDMIRIFHPRLVTQGSFQWYQKLP